MHDTSMDRGFGDESIGMNSSNLCGMNGMVYTPRRHREKIYFPISAINLCFQALDWGI